MNTKSDLSWRIGMIMLVLCATLIVAVLPAAADYTADKPLVEVANGTVSGGMNFTIGDSYYSSKLWNNDSYVVNLTPGIPTGCTVAKVKLYIFWTWSFLNTSDYAYNMYDTGVSPNMMVTINGGSPLQIVGNYSDQRESGAYNYPSGTYAYDVTANVTAGSTYVVNVTNVYPYIDDESTAGDDTQSYCIQAVGLLTYYNDGDDDVYHYWIDEGCDMTNVAWKNDDWQYGVAPSEAMTWANFSDQGDFSVDSATLITAVPSADTIYNKLIFNNDVWYSIWPGIPYSDFSWNTTDVTYQPGTMNYALICNGWDDNTHNGDGQMQAAGAFLLVKEA